MSPKDHDDADESAKIDDANRDRSPYEAPTEQPGRKLNTDDSVFAEPWMQPVIHEGDLSDSGPGLPTFESVQVDHSVWDEPGLSRQLFGEVPEDAVTWFRWYRARAAETTAGHTWFVTSGVILVGGLFAVIGTLLSQSSWGSGIVGVTLVGPTTEEIMKIALPLWLVEKRPWLYRNGGQILLSAFAGGVLFAVVENLIYLNVYIPNATASLAAWRWTICVLLHSGCSTIAGFGVWTIWKRFQRSERSPVLSDGTPWFVAAVTIHGLYNGAVTLLEISGVSF